MDATTTPRAPHDVGIERVSRARTSQPVVKVRETTPGAPMTSHDMGHGRATRPRVSHDEGQVRDTPPVTCQDVATERVARWRVDHAVARER